MNNATFQSFVSQKSQNQQADRKDAKQPTLGSRARSSIPMTPRSIDSTRNSHAEPSRKGSSEPPKKKFKSSYAPKGTKLASGYTDRTAGRRDHEGEEQEAKIDDKQTRLNALEEMLKLGQIDQETFNKSKTVLGVGGDTSSTHLVKGLDWKLLERVRRGEDVTKATPSLQEDSTEDVDTALEEALEKDVVPQTRARNENKNEMAEDQQTDTATIATHATSRDEILQRLKASRSGKAASIKSNTARPLNAIDPPAPSTLSDRFKKLPASQKPAKKKIVESINGRRREVLLITDSTGNTKRKTRWLDPETLSSLGAEQQPWGMDLPEGLTARQKVFEEEQRKEEAEKEDEDIFAGAGAYDPLGGVSDSDSDDSQTDFQGVEREQGGALDNVAPNSSEPVSSPANVKARNYFSGTGEADHDAFTESNGKKHDPQVLAALKRAAQLRQREESSHVTEDGEPGEDENRPDQALKHKQLLARLQAQNAQDDRDIDMSFGDSRLGDEDEDESLPNASWGDEADGTNKGKGTSSRKRGPKKRKGDKDNVKHLMNVLESRQKK